MPGGGVEAPDLLRRPREAHMGQVQPHAGHAGLKEPGQGLRAGTGGTQCTVNLDHRFPQRKRAARLSV